jgi:hypothetical protein
MSLLGRASVSEHEWYYLTDDDQLRESFPLGVSLRRCCLVCSAWYRGLWHLFDDDYLRHALELVERYADGLATKEELVRARNLVDEIHLQRVACNEPSDWTRHVGFRVARGLSYVLAASLAETNEGMTAEERALLEVHLAGWEAVDTAIGETKLGPEGAPSPAQAAAASREGHRLSSIFRDIFGSTLQEVPHVEPHWLAWNDGTLKRLAEAAYEERALPVGTLDNARLAVLADALEDAGCDNEVIFNYLREQSAVHVRGCWTIDLLLRRE